MRVSSCSIKLLKIQLTQKEPLDAAIELKRLDVVKLLLVKGAILRTHTLKDAIVKEDRYMRIIESASHEYAHVVLSMQRTSIHSC